MLTPDGSLPQQLGVVWSRLLEADSEGPSFISHAACARSVSSSRTFLSCACGALSTVQAFGWQAQRSDEEPRLPFDRAADLADAVDDDDAVQAGPVVALLQPGDVVDDGGGPGLDAAVIAVDGFVPAAGGVLEAV